MANFALFLGNCTFLNFGGCNKTTFNITVFFLRPPTNWWEEG